MFRNRFYPKAVSVYSLSLGSPSGLQTHWECVCVWVWHSYHTLPVNLNWNTWGLGLQWYFEGFVSPR